MKDYLQGKDVDAKFPRDVIKQSFHYELIVEGEVWMDMLEKRNLIAYIYNEKYLPPPQNLWVDGVKK